MNDLEYFRYLRRRSHLALAYRRLYLYPRLSRYLKGRVLDVGCGVGDMLRFRPNTVGIDINVHAVEWCRAQGLVAYLYDGHRLPFPDESFEGAIVDNVLEHLFSASELLCEIHRVLIAEGTLIIGVPGERGYAADPDHKVSYDEPSLRRVAGNAGFDLRLVLHAPFKGLGRVMTQYCLYGVFSRSPHQQGVTPLATG